jgi:hypothetical protein
MWIRIWTLVVLDAGHARSERPIARWPIGIRTSPIVRADAPGVRTVEAKRDTATEHGERRDQDDQADGPRSLLHGGG